jgi:hypothetical protein
MADGSICDFYAAFGREEPATGWVEFRLYDGPGLKIGELQVDACARHLEALRPAYERELVECRVARWEQTTRDRRP